MHGIGALSEARPRCAVTHAVQDQPVRKGRWEQECPLARSRWSPQEDGPSLEITTRKACRFSGLSTWGMSSGYDWGRCTSRSRESFGQW